MLHELLLIEQVGHRLPVSSMTQKRNSNANSSRCNKIKMCLYDFFHIPCQYDTHTLQLRSLAHNVCCETVMQVQLVPFDSAKDPS